MSVRMKDIAHTLGISQTTVSHVLRGRDGEFRIGAETARRVRDAVERPGYRPSVLARNLKHHCAYALALAVGDLGDPFWSALAPAPQAAPPRASAPGAAAVRPRGPDDRRARRPLTPGGTHDAVRWQSS